jgi:hypothetical protein
MEEQALLDLGQIFLQSPDGQKVLAKAEGVKGNVEDFKASKETLEKYKPVITTFTTKGTDKNGEYELRFGTVSISGLPELGYIKTFCILY